MTQAVALAQQASTGVSQGFKNRIINGAMVIDQRNAGASTTPTTSGYTLDRWRVGISVSSKFSVQQNAGSVTPPVGFANYLGVTSLSAYSVSSGDITSLQQSVEGYNIADLNWGSANAKTVTLSFWVRSSLTGTFGGALANSDSSRTYPFSYTISAANTWEQKSVTIAGDTSGTWATTTGIGIQVRLGLGVGTDYSGTAGSWSANNYFSTTGATSVVGTSGATFYITGVQLEVGSTATSFDYRPYELALCQRYYEKSYNIGDAPASITDAGRLFQRGTSQSGSLAGSTISIKVQKRANPTVTFYTGATSGSWSYGRSGASGTFTVTAEDIGDSSFRIQGNVGASWAACEIYGHFTASAEL